MGAEEQAMIENALGGNSGGDNSSGSAFEQQPQAPVQQDTNVQQVAESQAQQTPKPAPWQDVRSQLDPTTFALIEPHLRKADQEAQERITRTNQLYDPWKPFVESGRTPDFAEQAFAFADALNNNPQGVFNDLKEFLKENGMLEEEAQQAAEQITQEENPEEVDPQVKALMEWKEAQEAAQAEQERIAQEEQQAREVEAALDKELTTLQTTHPELSPQAPNGQDLTDLTMRWAIMQNSLLEEGAKPVSLEDAYKGVLEFRDKLIAIPRPGALAPRVLPTSGGGVTGSEAPKPVGKWSRNETQDYIASFLENSK